MKWIDTKQVLNPPSKPVEKQVGVEFVSVLFGVVVGLMMAELAGEIQSRISNEEDLVSPRFSHLITGLFLTVLSFLGYFNSSHKPQHRIYFFNIPFDLKHTFGRRLRAAGVSFEDRQDLLGHKSSRMTTHYSATELGRLIEAADMVCDRAGERPDLVILRKFAPKKLPQNSRKGKFDISEFEAKSLKDMAPPAGLEPATR